MRECVREIIPKRSTKVESVSLKLCQFLANFECEKKKLTQRHRGRKGTQRFRILSMRRCRLGDYFLEFVEEGGFVGACVVAQWLDALDENFIGFGAEQLHRFGDEIGERHGVGIVFAVEEVSLDPGRNDFD